MPRKERGEEEMARRNAGKPPDPRSTYSHEKVAEICSYIASGMSLLSACNAAGYKSAYQFLLWKIRHPEMLELYELAKEERAHRLADEMLEIADDSNLDVEFDEETGKFTIHGEAIQRAKLRVDARKWHAGKLYPAQWGEKTETTVVGDPNRPIAQVTFRAPQGMKEINGKATRVAPKDESNDG